MVSVCARVGCILPALCVQNVRRDDDVPFFKSTITFLPSDIRVNSLCVCVCLCHTLSLYSLVHIHGLPPYERRTQKNISNPFSLFTILENAY